VHFLGVLKSGDKAVIVDDVITTGETKYEAIQKLREVGCEPSALSSPSTVPNLLKEVY